MSQEEIERLLVDIFINDKSNDIETACSDETIPLVGGTIGIMYNDYNNSF